MITIQYVFWKQMNELHNQTSNAMQKKKLYLINHYYNNYNYNK